VLPNNINSASFLSKEERDVGIQRLSGVEHGTGSKEMYVIYYSELVSNLLILGARDEKFSWVEMGRAIFSPQTWLTAGAYFGLLSGIYSFGLFVGYA
jgi:hypothetical protein